MLNIIAHKITNRLVSRSIVDGELFDIYVYGFELLLSFLFSTLMIAFIGAAVGCIYQTIAFLTVFILLRSFSGGYHADTYSKCTIVTFITFASVLLLSRLLQVNYFAYLLLGVTGIILLSIFAPIEHPNKKITSQRKKWHKIISLILFIGFLSAGIGIGTAYPIVGNAVFYSLTADLLLLFAKNKHGKEKEL